MNYFFNKRNSDITYTVQNGDSLYSIAQKFNISTKDLMALNHLDNNLISPNQVLIIKKTTDPIEHIGSDICGTYSQEPIYDIYMVKPKDNLYTIAKKFHTTVAKLIYMNNLKNNLLLVNQQLKVPHSNENTISYIVKEGDNLYQIASNYNVTPKQIMDLNKLSSASVTIGQELKIPTYSRTLAKEYDIYYVKKEDSLYSISQKFNTTVDLIKKENNLINNLLFIGQPLIIPK